LSSFSALRQVFTGYLHEDFLVEHGTPAAAMRAFRADASPAEINRFRAESARFLAETEPLDFAAVRALVSRLGSKWVPPSRDALTALLRDAGDGSEPGASDSREPK
jgi:hypothetical protein